MNRPAALGPVVGALALVVLVGLRGSLDPHDLVRGFDLLVLVAMASAWNLVGGFGGLFSVGHSMFVGVGSYATAMLVLKADLPLGVTLLLAAGLTAAIAAVVGLPLMRLRAAYFSVASLGIALAMQAWMLNWDWTGASTGLNMPLSAYVDPREQYLLAVLAAAITVSTVVIIARGGLGLRLMALRDDEGAAAHIGIRRLPVALTTWAISGGLVGLAGALVALQKSSIEPVSAFSIAFTLDMIVATVIGGLGTHVGPILGAVIVYSLRQRFQDSAEWATLINGALIIVTVRFAPRGIWGALCDLARFIRFRLARQPAAESPRNDSPPAAPRPSLERTSA